MSYKVVLGGHEYELPDKRDCFINPATLAVYPWPVNHSPEGDEGNEKKRTIQETANTANVGNIRQQSGDQGMTLKRSGAILTVAHEEAFWEYFNICASQTIYLVEFDRSAYEVQIIAYDPKKIGSGGPTKNGLGYYVKWTMEMTIFSFLAGPAHSAGLVP
jgi:hypothetical protein